MIEVWRMKMLQSKKTWIDGLFINEAVSHGFQGLLKSALGIGYNCGHEKNSNHIFCHEDFMFLHIDPILVCWLFN
jgi:hypothetical protein